MLPDEMCSKVLAEVLGRHHSQGRCCERLCQLTLQFPSQVAELVKELRCELDQLLQDKIKNPSMDLCTCPRGSRIISMIVKLITTQWRLGPGRRTPHLCPLQGTGALLPPTEDWPGAQSWGPTTQRTVSTLVFLKAWDTPSTIWSVSGRTVWNPACLSVTVPNWMQFTSSL